MLDKILDWVALIITWFVMLVVCGGVLSAIVYGGLVLPYMTWGWHGLLAAVLALFCFVLMVWAFERTGV